MADEATVIESAASPEVQAEALKLGWIPPSRFKGEASAFVDAELYIERGQTILPIVKEQNKRLHAEVDTLKSENARVAAALKAAQTAIDQIEERHTVATQKAVESARRQVKLQLAAASEAGDHEGVAELTDQLTQLNAAEKEAPPVEKKPEAPPAYVPPPDLVEWNAENTWFGKDKRKTALALAIAQELREGGETSTGRVFFDKVKDELEASTGSTAAPVSKVEGARNGGSGEGRNGGGKRSYSSMPAEAREACDADTRQFVGPGKKYKTNDEWRARYAELYFEGA